VTVSGHEGSKFTLEGLRMIDLFSAIESFNEFNPEEISLETNVQDGPVVKDSNGNILQNGDSVTIIKDLPVKGFSKSIKVGTKVTNIRLVDGDHNIDCKIPGFGSMALKSEFVKKA
jgi:protein PhnA